MRARTTNAGVRIAWCAAAVALAAAVLGAPSAHAGALDDARAAAERGAWSEAAEHYVRALEAEPGSHEAAIGLARAAREAARADLYATAEDALRRQREGAPDDLDLRLALAELFLHRAVDAADDSLCQALFARAEAHFAAVVGARPDAEGAAVGLARAAHGRGDGTRAIQVLDAFLARRPACPASALYWKGRLLYLEAQGMHRAEGGGYPLSPAVRRLYERARGACRSSAAARDTSFDTWMHVAWASQVLGERAEALEAYERAFVLDPDSVLPLRGIEVLLAHDPDAHTRALERLRKLDPQRRNLRLLDGYALVKREQWEEAIHFFRSYLEKEGEDADALYYLGQALEKTGEAAEAVGLYERALKADGDHLHAAEQLDRRLRSTALTRVKKSLDDARALYEDYRRLMDLAPNNPYLRNNAAFALREGWKAHEADPEWRGILLLSARTYEEGAKIIGPWRPEKEHEIPFARRYGYAQIVNDTAVVLHLFEPTRDLARAEKYYVEALRYVGWGYIDAWTYLRKIYEEQERWQDLCDLARRCAGGLVNAKGEPHDNTRAAARAVADRLVRDGLAE